MKEIAFYGKGGIGKSTICANLSAALAILGRRVLQIGCDPKHDSTRLLMYGKSIMTTLDYMRTTNIPNYTLDKILHHGFGGVGCIEAGGPEPGVGCAGRGIISTFELLNRFNLKDNYEHVIYDVLGDVVCGGFAVPIRREYANAIFIVTSGEFMSLYAANNILRGVLTYDKNESRIAGIVYNKRNIENEDEYVARFAEAVGLPILAQIPRNEIFSESELLKKTVIEYDVNHSVSNIVLNLAQKIISGYTFYPAKPIENDELENIIFNRSSNSSGIDNVAANSFTITDNALKTCSSECTLSQTALQTQSQTAPQITPKVMTNSDETGYFSKNIIRGEPLHGCAFNGALCISAQIRDVISLAHSPKCCAHITYQTITHTGIRTMRVQGRLESVSLAPQLECSDMGETEVVFGGMDKLENKMYEIKARSPRAIIVVSACPAGIIGDDIDRMTALSEPDMPVITIKADGNMNGDFLQGLLAAYISIARNIIKRDVDIIPKTVNIIGEKVILTDIMDNNFNTIKGFLAHMGINVNCRFIFDTSYEALENFNSAELNLSAYMDHTGTTLERFLKDEFGTKFLSSAFPIGFVDTCKWIYDVANFFDSTGAAEELISKSRELYDKEIVKFKKALSGKKLMIVSYNYDLDWILQTAIDLGMEIVKVGLLNSYQDEDFHTNINIALPVEHNYDRENRVSDIENLSPDILLTNFQTSLANDVPIADTIPLYPDVGFFSGLNLAKRWARLLKINQKGEWRQDEHLFDKYFT